MLLVGWHPHQNQNVVCIPRPPFPIIPHIPQAHVDSSPTLMASQSPKLANTLVSKNRKPGKNGCCEGDLFYQRPVWSHFDGSQVVSMSLRFWCYVLDTLEFSFTRVLRARSTVPASYAIATQLWAQKCNWDCHIMSHPSQAKPVTGSIHYATQAALECVKSTFSTLCGTSMILPIEGSFRCYVPCLDVTSMRPQGISRFSF